MNGLNTDTLDYSYGLDGNQIQERIKEGKQNIPVEPPEKSVGQIICSNTFTYFNGIFALLALCVIFVHSYRSLTFLVAVVINLLVGIVQEVRSRNILRKMDLLDKASVSVVREGQIKKISSSELVQDDVIVLLTGMQIPADAVLISGMVQVNESLLTGESDEIKKEVGGQLLSGSFVMGGTGYARLTKVGEESYISQLTLQAKKGKFKNNSEMINEINRIIKFIGIIIIPVGIFMVLQGVFLLNNSLKDSVVSMTAALVGMIPEGLYLLTTMRLVLSTVELAKKKVLVHEMGCIESLARINVLCVDKTGTITEPEMSVVGYKKLEEHDEAILVDFMSVMQEDNITMKALKAYFTGQSSRNAISVQPFSSKWKYSLVSFEGETFVLGAPDILLKESYYKYQKMVEEYTKEGMRILLFGQYFGKISEAALPGQVNPLGLVIIDNPIRETAKETFSYFEKQGVNIKVISGDDPVTVSKVAQKAGITGAERYIDARTIQGQEEMNVALTQCQVFGRVTPEQKRQIVKSLQQVGNNVAMTGDGVNDLLAMKEADCSIAMASGSEACAHAAKLVLLDSDFAGMPDVVLEGRRVVNNIQRSASLFLIKNIFSFVMALLSMIFMFQYPEKPAQMSLISGLAIGAPAFLLALETNRSRIQGRFIAHILRQALPAAFCNIFFVVGIVLLSNLIRIQENHQITMVTLTLLAVGMVAVIYVSRPMNLFRFSVVMLIPLGTLFCFAFLRNLFELAFLTKEEYLYMGIIILGVPVVYNMVSLGYNKIVCKRMENQ